MKIVVSPENIEEVEINLIPRPDTKYYRRSLGGKKLFVNVHDWPVR